MTKVNLCYISVSNLFYSASSRKYNVKHSKNIMFTKIPWLQLVTVLAGK